MQYKVVRSQRKTLAIHVRYPDVEVRAPLFVSKREIDHFIRHKSSWIDAKLVSQRNKYGERYELAEGAYISYMGELKQIQFLKATKNLVSINKEMIEIQGPNLDDAKTRSLFESWLKSRAQTELTARTHCLIQKLAIEDRLSGIKFRKTKSKWGHCTSQGVLQFNWLILMAPEHVIDYLVTHEVCHLIHLNHSSSFWNLVASIHEGHVESRMWLKNHGHKLWIK